MKLRPAAVLVIAVLAADGCTGTTQPRHAISKVPTQSPSAAAQPLVRRGHPKGLVASVSEFSSPEKLAIALTQAQRTFDSARADTANLAEAGRTQQLAYRQLVSTPGWRAAALARLPATMHAVARDNIEAGIQLRMLSKPRLALPRWRIVHAPPPGVLMRFYRQAQTATGIAWTYLAAINFVETRFGRVRGTSTAGAQGPMQFLPSTWATIGRGDINNPRDAILAAARFLARHGGPRDMARAVFAYNPSPHYVAGITRYSEVMQQDPRAFYGYYFWRVIYRYARGDVILLQGYDGRHHAAS